MLDTTEQSILDLTQTLVRTPSRAGLDDYAPIFSVIERWLVERGIPVQVHAGSNGAPIALVAEAVGSSGPRFVLGATVDTAGFGDERAWSVAPTSAEVREGWLYGRGCADSKAGAAIFCHVLHNLFGRRHLLRGTAMLSLDADEHTGDFGGIRQVIDHEAASTIAGVMLGYPGFDRIGIGGRGFERAEVTVHGESAHSGSSSPRGSNAIAIAARFVEHLSRVDLPKPTSSDFPLSPRLSVTKISGGHGFSELPDLCHVHIDVRLTPAFGRTEARALVASQAAEVRAEFAGQPRIDIVWRGGWPAYRLPASSVVAATLARAAGEVLRHPVEQVVVGPSNIGNMLFERGVEATCGFGVAYRNVHAADECIDLSTVRPVYDVYLRAMELMLIPS